MGDNYYQQDRYEVLGAVEHQVGSGPALPVFTGKVRSEYRSDPVKYEGPHVWPSSINTLPILPTSDQVDDRHSSAPSPSEYPGPRAGKRVCLSY